MKTRKQMERKGKKKQGMQAKWSGSGIEYASTDRYAPFGPGTLGVAIGRPLRVLGSQETMLVLVAYSTDRNAALGTWLEASGRPSRESVGVQARPC